MTTVKKRRITLFMNHAISQQARAQAVIEELSLTDLVEKALITYLPQETVIKKVDVKSNLDPKNKSNKDR